MAKTYENYLLEYKTPRLTEAEDAVAKKKETAAATKAAYNQTVDTAADTAAGKYQQSIDALPGQSQALYDQNAVTEAISRKQIEERLSNMGHRQSGLNSSMQTALAVQKQGADQQVRRQEQEQLLALESAIDDIYAEAEIKKSDYAAGVDQATQDYYDNLLAQIHSGADSYATQMVAADKEYAAKIEAAKIEAAQQQYDNLTDTVLNLYKQNGNGDMDYAIGQAVQLGHTTGSEENDARLLNYQYAIDNGYTTEEATLYANAGGGEAGLAAVAEGVQRELSASGIDIGGLTKFYSGAPLDFLTSQKADMRTAISANRGGWDQQNWNTSVKKAAEKAEEKLADSTLSDRAKQYAIAQTVGQKLGEVWDVWKAAYDDSGDTVDEETLMKYMYDALLTQFGDHMVTVAATAAGISNGAGQ